MKKIVRKSHEKEIAYELSKKNYADKTEREGYFSPPPPVQIGLKSKTFGQSNFRTNFCPKDYLSEMW